MKARVLARRKRVEVPAHPIHLARDIERRAVIGALEEHVLKKMRDAGFAPLFMARPHFDPDANREALHALELLRDEREAIGKNGLFEAGPAPVRHI